MDIYNDEQFIVRTNMRNSNMLCDARIHLDDSKCFNVHRVIMCSVCDYFR